MVDPINLRQARKRQARREAQDQAAANRRRFGRTRTEKAETAAEDERLSRSLEGHRRASPQDHESGD